MSDDVKRAVRDELAALGGHLLEEYGNKDDRGIPVPAGTNLERKHDLAVLGGYLLEHYGPAEPA